MIRFFFLVVLLVIFSIVYVGYRNQITPHVPLSIPAPTNTAPVHPADNLPPQSIDIVIDELKLRIAWITTRSSSISLIPNYKTQETVGQIVENKHCKQAINAGFYTPNNDPIGLVIASGKEIHPFTTNPLLNGVFTIDNNNKAVISIEPQGEAITAIQSGPILILDSQPRLLRLRTDEEARRSVAGITPDGTVLLMSFFDPDNIYSGPRLTDLPSILTEFQKKSGIAVSDALNLDGGSASIYYDPPFFLQELTTVGALLCVK